MVESVCLLVCVFRKRVRINKDDCGFGQTHLINVFGDQKSICHDLNSTITNFLEASINYTTQNQR